MKQSTTWKNKGILWILLVILIGLIVCPLIMVFAEAVIIDGRLVYDDRHFVGMDVERIYREAARVAARVWKTVDKIKA